MSGFKLNLELQIKEQVTWCRQQKGDGVQKLSTVKHI